MRITITSPRSQPVTEGTAFSLTAKFWDDSTENWTASTPTTIHYRFDDESGDEITDWTTLSTGSSVTVPVSYTVTAIINNRKQVERKMLTVKANSGLSTQYQETYMFSVRNLVGQT